MGTSISHSFSILKDVIEMGLSSMCLMKQLLQKCSSFITRKDSSEIIEGGLRYSKWSKTLSSLNLILITASNLNGMNSNANPKILPIGQGDHEIEMIKELKKINYDGPIGILDHRSDTDTKTALQLNIIGLKNILSKDK